MGKDANGDWKAISVDLNREIPGGEYHSCIRCGGRGNLGWSEARAMRVCEICRVEMGELAAGDRTELPVRRRDDGGRVWMDDEPFGMFVHWGLPAAIGEEYTVFRRMPRAEYEAWATTFNPTAFDAGRLVGLAKEAGMTYLILVTKHHDGFAMFDTALSDYSIARGPFGRDVVAEVADACRAQGLRFGMYFSVADWHHPDYPTKLPPPGGYAQQPVEREDPERWARYLEFMYGQFRELCTNYGPVATFWFDGEWERSAADWQSERLCAMARELQPGVLLNNRIRFGGDYLTPETFLPDTPPPQRWQPCMQINSSWFYNPADRRFKSVEELTEILRRVIEGKGSLLLNVGPTGAGEIQREFVDRLQAMGAYLRQHGPDIGYQP